MSRKSYGITNIGLHRFLQLPIGVLLLVINLGMLHSNLALADSTSIFFQDELIPNDLPYVGYASAIFSLYQRQDARFEQFRWTLGLLGPIAGEEEIQKAFHRLINNDEPRGWRHQLCKPRNSFYFDLFLFYQCDKSLSRFSQCK